MRIGINASFLRKPATGIGQVSVHVLATLFAMLRRGEFSDREFIIYTEEKIPDVLPPHVRNVVHVSRYKRDDLLRKIYWEKYVLPQLVKRDHCDAFLSLYQSPTILTQDVRHLMLVHDLIPKLFPRYLNNIRKRYYQKCIDAAIQKADHIMTVSEQTKNDLIRVMSISPEKITRNYISVDPRFKQPLSIAQRDRVLRMYHLTSGYIYIGGGLEVRKNVANAMRAYAHVLRERKTRTMPKLVVSGMFVPSLVPLVTDVKKLAHELGIGDHVQILGFVPQDDLPALYHGAMMFVFASRYEGFGMPVLEAMSVGTPVITSALSSLPEVGAKSVYYCGDASVKEIAQAMHRLLDDRALREELASAGKKQAQRFSWETFVQKTFSLLS